jgi:type IV secretory pathway VirB10-like protein
MKRSFLIALFVAGCLMAAPRFFAQAPADSGQSQPASDTQKPASQAQKPAAPSQSSSSNPFPDDTSSVPVMPSTATPDLPPGTDNESEDKPILPPGDDLDPARSPEDTAPASAEQSAESSSSLANLDSLLPKSDDEQPAKKKKKKDAEPEPTQQEFAAKEISIGQYYLDKKNWKAAQSRFQSALVLAPEEPDVYWGLALSAHRLGLFWDARANYLKVIEYDPDSRHAKDAAKALKEPDLANAKPPAPGQPAETPR